MHCRGRAQVNGLERERDVYYNKLRDVELLLRGEAGGAIARSQAQEIVYLRSSTSSEAAALPLHAHAHAHRRSVPPCQHQRSRPR